jgi:hypothetical protein
MVSIARRLPVSSVFNPLAVLMPTTMLFHGDSLEAYPVPYRDYLPPGPHTIGRRSRPQPRGHGFSDTFPPFGDLSSPDRTVNCACVLLEFLLWLWLRLEV